MRISKESKLDGPTHDGAQVPFVMGVAGQATKPTVEKRSKKSASFSRVIPNNIFSRRRSKSRSSSSISSLKSIPSQYSSTSSSSSSVATTSTASTSINISTPKNNMARAAPDLTEETMKEFREAFALFDINNDGIISVEELGIFINKMGGTNIPASEADLIRMIAEVDADGDGAIDFPEFVTLMARKMNNVDKDSEIREAFNVYDKDGSGKISSKELLQLMSKFHKDVSKDDIDQMIKEADTNGDGEIEFEEFKRMLS